MGHKKAIPLAFLLILLSASASVASASQYSPYTQHWSKVKPLAFPGGTYKFSNVRNFPGSSKMSAALIDLHPGGLRELHWHNEVEWAIVLNGTCRATVVESGEGVSETWDYGDGDVWYFRSNEGHMIQGLSDGCTYLAGYDSGTFDDLLSPSASSALSDIPSDIAGQALGVTPSQVSKHLKSNTFTFINQGPVPSTTLDEFRDSLAGGVPAQPVTQTHRLQLNKTTYHVETAGGWIKLADTPIFPISTQFTGALVYFAPGGMRQFHWHTNFNEWQYVINGTLEAGVVTAPGVFEKSVMRQGDAGYAPMSSAHYLKATDGKPAWAVLMFDNAPFTNIDLPVLLSQVPKDIVATSLNTSAEFPDLIDYQTPAMVPPVSNDTIIVLTLAPGDNPG